MTEEQEKRLVQVFGAHENTNKKMAYIFDSEIKFVSGIGEGPKPLTNDVPEPGLCAYLSGQGYVALYNAEIIDFALVEFVREEV
jgi:hypothetical protein